jgi:hypothetical protein
LAGQTLFQPEFRSRHFSLTVASKKRRGRLLKFIKEEKIAGPKIIVDGQKIKVLLSENPYTAISGRYKDCIAQCIRPSPV